MTAVAMPTGSSVGAMMRRAAQVGDDDEQRAHECRGERA